MNIVCSKYNVVQATSVAEHVVRMTENRPAKCVLDGFSYGV